jgi:CRISPR/Cas system-associated protein Cas10 (large subunit of type III CRISPR-Cas system)
MLDLALIKMCALLHDIGKPICWANGESFSDHVLYTYDIISNTLGSDLAWTAARHHASQWYPEDYRPQTVEEKIIHIADSIASGADRPEDPYKEKHRPKLPIALTHPLSKGSVVKEHYKEELMDAHKNVEYILRLKTPVFKRDPMESYLEIFEELSESKLTEIPAYTEAPINDNSLFDHLKLTVAVATCIYQSNGYIGDRYEDYEFSLLSGDADKIGNYIDTSKRLPDLIAGSLIVKEATERAVQTIKEKLGPDCIMYYGGGNFLAIAPPKLSRELLREAKESFEDYTKGQLTITTSSIKFNGKEMQEDFGKVWEKARLLMYSEKINRPIKETGSISSDSLLCDVCHTNIAEGVDKDYYATLDGIPKPDNLCKICLERRKLGRDREGIAIDSIATKDKLNEMIGVLKMDGDRVGKVFSGEKLLQYNKVTTPARLASLSRLLENICKELEKIVAQYGGACVYAGGDDILTILPGDIALRVALHLSEKYSQMTLGEMTISAGLIITKPTHPLYLALQGATQLLKNAKKQKDSIDYEIVREIGYSPYDLSVDKRQTEKQKRLTKKPYRWKELTKLLEFTNSLKNQMTYSQVRQIVAILTSGEGTEYCDFHLKRQFLRGYISYEQKLRFMEYISSGMFLDAVELVKVVS